MTFGLLFAADEDDEYFDGEEEEVEENAAPERTVMGKGQSTAEPNSPGPSSTQGGALGAWALLDHPILSLSSFPVATATLPAVEKLPRAQDVRRRFGMGGTQGRARQPGEPCPLQHTTLFYTGANRTNSARFVIPLFCI